MYRLLISKSLTPLNHKLLTTSKCSNLGQKICLAESVTFVGECLQNSYSKLNASIVSRRPHSTTPNAEILRLIRKKKKKSKNKKFTELLQVTEASTTQIKASVQKLKAKKLSEFIDKPTVLLSNLTATTTEAIIDLKSNEIKERLPFPLQYTKYNLDVYENEAALNNKTNEAPIVFVGPNTDVMKITKADSEVLREIIESYQSFKELNEIEMPGESVDFSSNILHANPIKYYEEIEPIHEMEDEINEGIEDEQITDLIAKTTNSTKKSGGKFKSRIHKTLELENLAKQKCLSTNLFTYLELCVTGGMLNRGLATVLHYRFRFKRFNTAQIVDIKLYNILLHGYAEKGNLTKIKEILTIFREDNITCDAQSFAAIIECIGRDETIVEKEKLLEKYIKDASNIGITLNDIMDQSKFIGDQREVILKMIREIEPNFQPIYTPPQLAYSNELLNSLNRNVKPIKQPWSKSDSIDAGCNIMDPKGDFTCEQLHEFAEKQLNHEMDSCITVKSIQKFPEVTPIVTHYRKKLVELQTIWRAQICAAFSRDLNTLRSQTHCKSNRAINLFPYLRALDTGQYADILMREMRILAEGSETYSPTVGQLYRELGQKVQNKYQLEQKKKNGLLQKTEEIYDNYIDIISHGNSSDNSRQSWQRLVHHARNHGPSMDISDRVWPMAVMVGVGRFLYNILMRDLKIDVNSIKPNSKTQNLLPAFYTLFRNQGRVVKEEVKPHPVLSKLFRGSQQETLTFDAKFVPMLCPPQPWSTPVNGGYLITKSELIRLPQQAFQQWNRINETQLANLYPALDSLNQLGAVPWEVNSEILDVIIEVFNNGGSAKLDVPQPPNALTPLPSVPANNDLTNKEKFQLFRQKLAHRRRQAEMYSLWCDCLYRLSLANHFRDKVFWLPHNMDFRGRVYPIPPHLNHLGSDLARCLLVFHKAKPLGKDGFNWLKLHCINLTGLKKRDSITERLLFAEQVMDEILDSADNPLTGRMWWAKSDEPWQTLACCMEIAKVARCPDPEQYLSNFPIHQDGSCNGLQHYAALGRDTAGAVSVNLAPSTVPQDVYSAVAVLVEDARAKDASNGIQVAQILNGFVRRKVIKQTVMTTVYGVTRYGARLQICRQLKDIDEFPKDWVWPASTYLTTKTFESLQEMFTSTKEIQDWFTDCARMISGVCFQNVEWITPLGLPVVQPYNRIDKRSLPKSNRVAENFSMDIFEKPNIMKQKNAFPPNFIHSLDSSHMMLTSLNCEKEGLTFISVHDCFWTHACTVPEMNKICREQFVQLHSQPILEDLSRFLNDRYCVKEMYFANDGSIMDTSKRKLNKILNQLPVKGDFDLNNVLKSIYFFS